MSKQINEKIEAHQQHIDALQSEKIANKDLFQNKINEIQEQLQQINLERMQKLKEEEMYLF